MPRPDATVGVSLCRGAGMDRAALEAAILRAKADAIAGRDLAQYYDDAVAPESADHARQGMDAALDRLLDLWLGGTT